MKKRVIYSGISGKQIKSIFCLVVFLHASGFVYAQNEAKEKAESVPTLLFDALKDQRFYKAYKNTFEAYWGTRWVAAGAGPTVPASKKMLVTGETVYLYTTCRPHFCNTEYLYFLYAPNSGRGWGILNIRTGIEEQPWGTREIENILLNAAVSKK